VYGPRKDILNKWRIEFSGFVRKSFRYRKNEEKANRDSTTGDYLLFCCLDSGDDHK
jgi:hypothetical protein